jgi:hypothetical protein
MRELDPAIAALLADRHGAAESSWMQRVALDGDDAFPLLRLPADRLRYATDRGYPVDFAVCRIARVPTLVVQLTSYAFESGPGDWAIPLAYEPKTDDQRIRKALGFDEGWEDVEHECTFTCTRDTLPFWRDAIARGRFGLTIVGGKSLYPVKIGQRERDALSDFEAD